jgi:predicted phosphohydrolase
VRINYFSDIHLEFGHLALPNNDADLIIAAGDIGVGKQGIEWIKATQKTVIYIAGNHEFYMQEYKETLSMLRQNCESSNIQFLEKNSVIIAGVRFIGCTLWTDLLKEGDKKAYEVGLRLNDFRVIRFKDRLFDQADFTQLNRRSLFWLESELNKPFAGKTVVISHHAPSHLSWKEAPNDLKRMAYCNELDDLIAKYKITAWFHGHIHSFNDYRLHETRVLCNPRGYFARKEVEGFDQNRTVDI